MDAHALLTSQGWRGKGHSLHSTSDNIGLSRPLLVSQKQNTLGVGKKQHRTSDMWWMNAFDKTLKGLDTSKEGVVVQTVNSGGLDMAKKGGGRFVGTGGLYACFVKGETLVGSVKDVEAAKVELEIRVRVDKKAAKKAEKKADKRRRKECETKEERRKRKSEKRARRAAKESTSGTTTSTEENEDDETEQAETKEQRKERRRLKKASKAAAAEDSSDTPSLKGDKKKKRKN